ncbi:MAG: tyrosine-type recombinase/integrase [Gemmataceae bacterium]
MSNNNSTAPAPSGKPTKPYADFPLYAHATKRWAKKIRGQLHYFGSWDDGWQAALDNYEKQKDALHAGRKPREQAEGTTVKELCNAFLNAKNALVESGELLARTWNDYKFACELIVSRFGKSRLVEDLGPDDFAALRNYMAKRWAVTSVRTVIQWIRCVFKFAADNQLISKPVCYGQNFKRPSPKVLRIERARRGPKLFTAAEIRQLLDAASVPVRAQILLGINCGFGNTDCGTLPQTAVDWSNTIIDFPRPKTGIPRRCPLWPETVAALRDALDKRPEPKNPEHAGLVFLTQRGLPWAKGIADSPLTKEMAKLLRRLRINGRKGLGFYTLRHTFRTVADESKDQPAVDFIMGHEVAHMSSVYRETISDSRLRAVADPVRLWLFPSVAFIKSVE